MGLMNLFDTIFMESLQCSLETLDNICNNATNEELNTIFSFVWDELNEEETQLIIKKYKHEE